MRHSTTPTRTRCHCLTFLVIIILHCCYHHHYYHQEEILLFRMVTHAFVIVPSTTITKTNTNTKKLTKNHLGGRRRNRRRTDLEFTNRGTTIGGGVSGNMNIIQMEASTTTESATKSSTIYEQDMAVETFGKPVELKYTEYKNNDNDNKEGEEEEGNDPVIILHGLLGQKRNFASLASSLSTQLKNKRSIYTLDLRNHGENHHDWRDEMSYTDMCHDVLHFMNQNNLKRVILIGHSMGGKVAKSLALSYPHRTSGLVVLDIAPVKYTEGDVAWKGVKGIIDTLVGIDIDNEGMTKRDIDESLRLVIEDPALRAFVLTNLEEDRKNKMMRWKINIQSISSQLDVIAGFDVLKAEMGGVSSQDDDNPTQAERQLKQQQPIYQGDTFFINGGTSTFVKGSHMKIISEYFPNYMLTTIRGSGHWVHAEAPDNTLALLKRYLDR